MKKIRCLVTGGPTREYFDPVRYISNPSSGKTGWNIANAAQKAGWDTALILGPSSLPDADCSVTERVVSAQDMLEACMRRFDECDILIMTAAVSDVRPKTRLTQKAKKDDIPLTAELERTPDILKQLSLRKSGQILVGFAAETQNVLDYAKRKLKEKNLDCIAVNDVSAEGLGFGSNSNKLELIMRDGKVVDFPLATKELLAKLLIDFLASKFFERQ
ncbi:MAG: hypothetical protein DBX55_04430 [Verrucomicrobia bacterium]|nr:MAG: hypothetical protein DBX55_04430 [Verrucomicrobiota bacterium]